MSIANKGKHKNRIHTEKSRKNMSEARKGIIFSEDHRKNLSEALKKFYSKD